MRRIILTAGILICLLAFIPSVSAYDDSVRTLLFVGNSESVYNYDVGDNVPVEVRFFDSGQPKDADSTPTVTLNSYEPYNRDIQVSRAGVGIYSGTFTISEGDVEESSYLSVSADATLGKENEADDLYDYDRAYEGIFVAGEPGFDVELVFDGSGSSYILAKPGNTIHMTITVTDNGNNVDPTSLEVTADDKSLTHTRTGTGSYKTSYSISSTELESQAIDIDVDAEYNDESAWASGDIIVDFYSIWYHKISITGSYVQFELCAADMDGSVLSGASIDFSYEIDDYGIGEDSPSQSGTTNAGGKASFTISHSSASMIYVEGTLRYSGRTQHFQNDILLSTEGPGASIEEPSDWDDFEVIYQENAGSITPGETVTMEYIAYSYAIPVSNQPIYYYLYTPWDFLKSGSTTCDGNGRFSITLTIPDDSSGTIYAEFESPFEKENSWEDCDCNDGLVYREGYDFIHFFGSNMFTDRDTSISIGTDSFEIGSTVTITASRPNSLGYLAIAQVLVGELTLEELGEDYRPEWEAWVGLSLSFVSPVVVKNNRINQDILLPEFLPGDETYTVFVLFLEPEGFSFDYNWNYIHVRPAASQEGDEEEDLQDLLFSSPLRIFGIGIPCLLILLIIIILLVVLVAKSRPRKEERRARKVNVVTVEPEPVVTAPRPTGQPYATQRDYYGGYNGPRARTAPQLTTKRAYPTQHTQPYQVSQTTYRNDIRREFRSSAPPFEPTGATRQRYEPMEKRFQRPSSVTVRCQGCRNVFYIQDKSPPFKTKCPFCARHNIVV